MSIPKTKNQIAEELGVSLRTLQSWLKKNDLHVPRGLISPEKQTEIFTTLGYQEENRFLNSDVMK